MIDLMNYYAKNNIPFLFIINFDKTGYEIIPVDKINNNEIIYYIDGISNYKTCPVDNRGKIYLKKEPVSFEKYNIAFDKVIDEFKLGNSFLVNLTFPTEIETNLSLKEIFFKSSAKYKLYYKDKFVVFSPESFVKINNDKIYSFPMKGTINADIPDAAKIIIEDEKEFAEHITIVDLIRNDLGMISKNVTVDEFRYIDRIETLKGNLLQVSSIVSGELDKNWNENIGGILDMILPAGSVTGAPKKKTVEIIKNIENYNRNFYTGIFGYCDGKNLNSGVMIRFIEKNNEQLIYKSGGGITIYSDVKKEYEEMIEKVYVPITGNN